MRLCLVKPVDMFDNYVIMYNVKSDKPDKAVFYYILLFIEKYTAVLL